MTPGTGIARECQWAFVVASIIEKVVVVQYPKRIDTLHSGVLSLLPINPPEIYAFVFEWAMQDIEKRFQEPTISDIEVYWVICRCVVIKCFCHVVVKIFVALDTVCRVVIQSNFQFTMM